MSCLDVMFHQSYGAHYLPASSAAAAAAYKAAYYHHQHQQQVGVQTTPNSNDVVFVCFLILGYFLCSNNWRYYALIHSVSNGLGRRRCQFTVKSPGYHRT